MKGKHDGERALPADGCCDCGAFFLDAFGSFGPSDVLLRWTAQPRRAVPQVDELIEQTWQRQVDLARHQQRRLFDGALCRLIEWTLESPGRLDMTVGPVSFREFLGTNAYHPYVRYVHGPEVLANPLGVSAALRTSDGLLLLGRRSQQVAKYPGWIHPVSGIVETAGAAPDVFAAMHKELAEELAVKAGQVEAMVCLGLVRDKTMVQPELVFDVSVSLEARQVLAMSAQAPTDEHAELLSLRDHPASVVSFLQANIEQMTPVAQASLLLHGLRHWGSGWFTAARGFLHRVI